MTRFRPTRAPEPLRATTLRAARDAWTQPADPWARFWNPPSARLAWAAAIVLLLVAHLSMPASPAPAGPALPARASSADPEVAPYVRMSRSVATIPGAAALLEASR